MSKSKKESDELHLALYILNKRFNSPVDMIRYWAFTGPCIEEHPSVEDCQKRVD